MGAGETGSWVLALSHYDRHVPFFDGTVDIPGLAVWDVGQTARGRHGDRRHERMLRDGEFAAAEVSLASYLMARQRGAPLTAVPVFPRRLFTPSLFWVLRDSPLNRIEDLPGRAVGIKAYQTTLSVLAKADLATFFGVPWRTVRWVSTDPEVMPLEPPPGVWWESRPGASLVELLASGEVEAVIVPHPPPALQATSAARRLLRDARAVEEGVWRRRGYYPIMHLVAVREAAVAARPDLPRTLMDAFTRAFAVCRERWEDPNWSMLAWGALERQEEAHRLSPELWQHGLSANRANLEWFIAQAVDQGLIPEPIPVETLFHPSTLDT